MLSPLTLAEATFTISAGKACSDAPFMSTNVMPITAMGAAGRSTDTTMAGGGNPVVNKGGVGLGKQTDLHPRLPHTRPGSHQTLNTRTQEKESRKDHRQCHERDGNGSPQKNVGHVNHVPGLPA